jgi:two-component system sensor histidine kinase PilS (NtrC family)
MVASNVQRLKRLVDDVTEVAPGVQPDTQALDISELVHETCVDWVVVNGLESGAAGVAGRFQLRIEAPGLVGLFDAEHLRRVLVNLLDNALRHADDGPGSIRVLLRHDGEALEMVVRSAGAPVPPEVERHLFEPFFSTRSRGSGLGLYICRELCERHGGRIDFRRAADGAANEFSVRLRTPSA